MGMSNDEPARINKLDWNLLQIKETDCRDKKTT